VAAQFDGLGFEPAVGQVRHDLPRLHLLTVAGIQAGDEAVGARAKLGLFGTQTTPRSTVANGSGMTQKSASTARLRAPAP
jgi:hypothetical protein